jgi:hypothetical protein
MIGPYVCSCLTLPLVDDIQLSHPRASILVHYGRIRRLVAYHFFLGMLAHSPISRSRSWYPTSAYMGSKNTFPLGDDLPLSHSYQSILGHEGLIRAIMDYPPSW